MKTEKQITEKITGWSSACGNKEHILMLDYDNVTRRQAIESIKSLQHFYKLGDMSLWKTTKGFHIYCLDKISFFTFIRIAVSSLCERAWLSAQLGNCEKDFKLNLCKVKRHFVLRLSPKNGEWIKFDRIIKSKHNDLRIKSNAHRIILEKFALPNKLEFRGIFDTNDNVILVKYHYQKRNQ